MGARGERRLTSLTTRLAAGGAAILAAAALTACASTSTRSPATPTAPAAAPSSAAAAYNATDIAFTSGIIRLEGQARALDELVDAHSSSTQLHRYTAQVAARNTAPGRRVQRITIDLWL
jgi:hypothetical protein